MTRTGRRRSACPATVRPSGLGPGARCRWRREVRGPDAERTRGRQVVLGVHVAAQRGTSTRDRARTRLARVRRADPAPKCGSRSTPGPAASSVVPVPVRVGDEPARREAGRGQRRRRSSGRRLGRSAHIAATRDVGVDQAHAQRRVVQRAVQVAVALVGITSA